MKTPPPIERGEARPIDLSRLRSEQSTWRAPLDPGAFGPIPTRREAHERSTSDPSTAPAEPVMPAACRADGCGGGTATVPRMPAFDEVRVNGVEIDPEAIAREIQHHPAKDGAVAWTEAARALAIRELLLQEAGRLGLEAESNTDEVGRAVCDDEALIGAVLDQAVRPERPTEAECRRYYEARRERFRTPDLFEVSHVLIEPARVAVSDGGDRAEEANWATAEAKARAIIACLADGPEAFAAAAREHSSCPSAQQDGTLGQVRRGELVPEFQAIVERLEPGQLTPEPVRTRYGWHIVRLARRLDGQTLPFSAVRSKIADMLEARGWTLASTRYVVELARGAEIEGVVLEPIEMAAESGP